jgi:mannose-1-phosphate guanylyltransferase
VIWSHTRVGTLAKVNDAIIGRGCHVGRSSIVGPGSVLGDKTSLTDYTRTC